MTRSAEEQKAYYYAHHERQLQIKRQSWWRNRAANLRAKKEYYETHKEEVLAAQREYHQRNLVAWAASNAKRYARNGPRLRSQMKKRYALLKLRVLTHYSHTPYPSCVVCGEVDVRCLSIDHINGGGTKERERGIHHGGSKLYSFIESQGYPEGYQTMCMNDQFRKRWLKNEKKGREPSD